MVFMVSLSVEQPFSQFCYFSLMTTMKSIGISEEMARSKLNCKKCQISIFRSPEGQGISSRLHDSNFLEQCLDIWLNIFCHLIAHKLPLNVYN